MRIHCRGHSFDNARSDGFVLQESNLRVNVSLIDHAATGRTYIPNVHEVLIQATDLKNGFRFV